MKSLSLYSLPFGVFSIPCFWARLLLFLRRVFNFLIWRGFIGWEIFCVICYICKKNKNSFAETPVVGGIRKKTLFLGRLVFLNIVVHFPVYVHMHTYSFWLFCWNYNSIVNFRYLVSPWGFAVFLGLFMSVDKASLGFSVVIFVQSGIT